jgi:hypothetical protein
MGRSGRKTRSGSRRKRRKPDSVEGKKRMDR